MPRSFDAPKTSEAQFLRQVLQLAKLCGWRTMHMRPAQTAKGWRTAVQGDGAGFPDLLLIRGAEMIVAELKVGTRQATKEQGDWLTAFAEAGIAAFVWKPKHWDTIQRILERK